MKNPQFKKDEIVKIAKRLTVNDRTFEEGDIVRIDCVDRFLGLTYDISDVNDSSKWATDVSEEYLCKL